MNNNNDNNDDDNNNNNDDDNNNGVSEVEPVEFIVCLLHDFAPISVPDAAASQSRVVPPFSQLTASFVGQCLQPSSDEQRAFPHQRRCRDEKKTLKNKRKRKKKKLVGLPWVGGVSAWRPLVS